MRGKVATDETTDTQTLSAYITKIKTASLPDLKTKIKDSITVDNLDLKEKIETAINDRLDVLMEYDKLRMGGNRYAFARGGVVPGIGSGDTVPAMLTPKEGVLNTAAMRVLGENAFNAMNRLDFSFLMPQVQRFAEGGIVADAGPGPNLGTLNLSAGGQSMPVRVEANVAKTFISALKRAGMVSA